MRWIITLLVLLLAPISLKAESRSGGLAIYSAMDNRFPCARIEAGFRGLREKRLAVLWNTFGRSFRCLNYWARDSRPKYLEVHLLNEVCQRNRRCGNYEFLYGVSVRRLKKLIAFNDMAFARALPKYAAPVFNWFNEHPNVTCRISIGLESNLSYDEYLALYHMLLPTFPTHCTLVWNPVIPRARIVNSIYERHGNKAALQESCIANLDGQDIRLKTRSVIFPDNAISIKEAKAFLKSFNQCETKFLWVPEFNLIHPGPFKNPRKRSNYPSINTMKALNAILKG